MSDNITRWQELSGSEGDVVISTRIRLARNLKKLPFPWRINDEQARIVEQAVERAVDHSARGISKGLRNISLRDLTDYEALAMAERHLVSKEFVSGSKEKMLFLSPDETVSVMVNEEDHIRLQSMQAGLDLERAYSIASTLDDALNSSLHFAFSKELGYLTQCPTNLGTGMRASVMLHLPMLKASGELSSLQSQLSKLGLTLRGTYGESTKAIGSLYQLSNQVSLGISEEEAIKNLKSITLQICQKERTLRDSLKEDIHAADRISRALGVLKSARLISSAEAMDLLSTIRLGISIGVINDIPLKTINRLFIEIQPNTLALKTDIKDTDSRDKYRAEMLSSSL